MPHAARRRSPLFAFLPLVAGLVLAGCGTLDTKVYSNIDASPAQPAGKTGPRPGGQAPDGRKETKAREGGPAAIAVLQQRGFRFWLVSEEKRAANGKLKKEAFDVLKLRPDSYMIGFVQLHPRAGGAAFCRVEAGRAYSFEITGREYMPRSGSYVLRGRCVPPSGAAPADVKTESK